MAKQVEYLPIEISAMKRGDLDNEDSLFFRDYILFPAAPEGLEDNVSGELQENDVAAEKIASYLNASWKSNTMEIRFYTVWKLTHIFTPSSWFGEEEYDFEMECLGVADTKKWTPESLGLIQ